MCQWCFKFNNPTVYSIFYN